MVYATTFLAYPKDHVFALMFAYYMISFFQKLFHLFMYPMTYDYYCDHVI